jgi:F-type H+-transporting ATPase subunit b
MMISLAVATSEPGAFEAIKTTFGFHWAFILAQLVNFFLVIFVLKKFAFGPIQNMLEQRRARIVEGEEKLKRIEKQLAESEETTSKMIAEANRDAQRLIDEARESATRLSETKAQEAVAQAQQILSKAEAQAKAEREQISTELKKEFGRLVTETTTQVTGKVLDDEDKNRINQEALAKVGA